MPSVLAGVLPPWAQVAGLSVVVIAAGYLVGQLLKHVVGRRLAALALRTDHSWDDAVAAELSRRVPFWSSLLGVYVASGYWALPEHIDKSITKALIVVVGLSITLMIAAIVASLTRDYGRRVQGDVPMTSLTQNVARIVVVVLGTLTILNQLGISIAPMLTALGVGGLAVALALQDTLANLFAGIQVTLARQVRVGDYIRLDTGHEGHLVDIAWRSARILTGTNNVVVVPNSKLAQATVVNYGLPDKQMITTLELGVAYGSDLERVEQVTVEEARAIQRSVPGAVAGFEPVVRFQSFDESGIGLVVVMRALDFPDQGLLKHELIKRLHQRYAQEGITIPFPTRTLVAAEPGLRILRDSAA
jgi:small-conductance mechanosensitive channel